MKKKTPPKYSNPIPGETREQADLRALEFTKGHLSTALGCLHKVDCTGKMTKDLILLAMKSVDSDIDFVKALPAKKPACKHLTGYWIDKANGIFRCCDQCGFQFYIGDVEERKSRKIDLITAESCSRIAMVQGNENKFRTVVTGTRLKEWTGIGWIDLGPASENDRLKYPTVK